MRLCPSLPTAAILVAALGLGGCVSEIQNRGNLADPDRLAQIHVGETTRDQVLDTLGTPTATATFDKKTYYYIGEVQSQTAFFDPEVKDRKVVAVHFDDADVVSAIDIKGKDDGQDVGMVDRVTPTPGRDASVVQEMLGNIGRFGGNPRPAKAPRPGGV